MPEPEHFQAFFFLCEREEDITGVIDAIRPLRMNGTLRSTIHIANDYKVFSALRLYPWEEMGGKTPLSAEIRTQFRKQLRCGMWNGSGGLYGTRAQVAEARRLLKSALHGRVANLRFLDDKKLELAARYSKVYGAVTGLDLRRTLELVRPVFGLMKGVPTDQPMQSCYWRKRSVPEKIDVDRDGCGLLWCSPIAPLNGSHAAILSKIAEQVLMPHGFEPMISLSVLTDRTMGCVISISYDRNVNGEDEKAISCYNELLDELAKQGYYPYRLGVQSMDRMNGPSGYNTVLRRIKDALDPNGIISPGRYEPTDG